MHSPCQVGPEGAQQRPGGFWRPAGEDARGRHPAPPPARGGYGASRLRPSLPAAKAASPPWPEGSALAAPTRSALEGGASTDYRLIKLYLSKTAARFAR